MKSLSNFLSIRYAGISLMVLILALGFALPLPVFADAAITPPVKIQHPPFAEAKCLSCHKAAADGKPIPKTFIMNQPDLCYQCHERKDKNTVIHPAMKGKCTSCHSAHESAIKPLLKSKVEDMCTTCHDAPGMDLPIKHLALVMSKSCVRCHNPHSSPYPKMLKAVTPILCTYCHTDMGRDLNNENVHIHPAVYLGCENCHAPHGSENPKLLKQMPNDLCFTCHDKKMIDGGHPKAGHPTSGQPDPIYKEKDLSCISCHKPHFSPNKKVLRYNFNTAPYDGSICSVCHWQVVMSPPGPPRPDWND